MLITICVAVLITVLKCLAVFKSGTKFFLFGYESCLFTDAAIRAGSNYVIVIDYSKIV